MPAAVRIEDFLAGQGDLDRTAGHEGQLGGDQLVRENVALPAKTTPVWGGNHPDPAHGHLEHLSQGPVDIVRRLGGGPEGQSPILTVLSNGGVLLHRQVGVAFEENDVLALMGSAADRFLGVPELEGNRLVNIGPAVDRLPTAVSECLLQRHVAG